MTRRQDLLEAQAYARRRVLAVLVSGTSDGLEPEPVLPGRALAGGVVLAVLVVVVVLAVELVN